MFDDVFQTMLKMQTEMSDKMKIDQFFSRPQREALQTFRIIKTSNKLTLEEVLIICRRKQVKPQSQATAKHKWQYLTSNPTTEWLSDFHEELDESADRTLEPLAQQIQDSLFYAKLPPPSPHISYAEEV